VARAAFGQGLQYIFVLSFISSIHAKL
jgi:hypothetical protein